MHPNTHLHAPRAAHARWGALLTQARTSAAAVLRLPYGHPDVEDRAQDTMVHFLGRGVERFDATRGTPEALVTVIARNCALDHLRRGVARARAGDALRAAGRGDCDGAPRRAEAVIDLTTILARLHPAQAAALVSIDLEGERIADAALRQGRSYAAVNAQIGHARSAARRVARELETAA
jgi:DNA-directed RNA polymerase specialized sigma24 family protein